MSIFTAEKALRWYVKSLAKVKQVVTMSIFLSFNTRRMVHCRNTNSAVCVYVCVCVCVCVCVYMCQPNQCDLISSVYCGVCDMPLQARGPVSELALNPLRHRYTLL